MDIINDNEGICAISEVTSRELENSIRQGDIEDGYTIGTLTL